MTLKVHMCLQAMETLVNSLSRSVSVCISLLIILIILY